MSHQGWAQSDREIDPIVNAVDLNIFTDGRLRYQFLDQDNIAENAEALTLNIKAGLELEVSDLFSALVEVEAGEQLINDFNDTTNGRTDRPVILDVDGIELNRLQLQTEIIPKTRLTLGRQDFALDNWRFLGAWHFRQNQQTFDAVRAETSLGNARINLGYFGKVHRHFGDDSPIGEFTGDSFVFNVNHPAPVGQVSFFHYAFDLETGLREFPINTLSSQTTGVRWHGRRHGADVGVVWDAAFARQSDYADNPDDFKAYYWDVNLEGHWRDLEFSAGLETLGSDDGIALQTPLGSLHGFQGVTDRFFRTPVDGLKDYNASLTYNIGEAGIFKRVRARAGYHNFNSNSNSRDYGRELNFALSGTIEEVTLLIEFGDYKTQALATDRGLFVSDARSLTFSASYSFD